jgi:hypothetical protein
MTDDWEDADFMASVGRVAIASSSLEFAAGLAFKRLLQSDLGELVAMGQTWRTVYESCLALLAAIDPTDQTAGLEAALKSANALYERRNRVIHGYWVGVAEGKATMLPKRYGKRRVDVWSTPALIDLSDQIVSVTNAIFEIVDGLQPRR